MPYITADRIKENTTSIGTGIILLSGAAKGYRAFSSVMAINDTCPYAIVNNNSGEWEVGIATYSALNTLTRTTIHSSSNNNLIVSFQSGSKDVFLGPTAKSLPGYDPATNTIAVNGVTAGTATIDTIKADAVLARDKNLIIEAGNATGIGDGGSILIRPGAIDTSGNRGTVVVDSLNVGQVRAGSSCTVIGTDALPSSTGTGNTAVGANVFANGLTGSSNTAIGVDAAKNLSSGQFDTFIGANAGHAATATVSATAVGSYAGYTGSDNSVALGAMSLFEATGAGNIGVGNNAGRSITSGTNNLALGINAGSSDSVSLRLSSGSNNTLIGAGAVTGLGNGAAVNSTVIGANAIGQGSNTTTIGNASTTTTHIAGTIAPLPLGTGGSVTNAVGNGTTVTYTCANTFSVGQVVTITGLTITTGAALNLANQTITACTALNFTIANTTVGTATGQSGTVTTVGAGRDVVIKAANGSGAGAGGNLILQAGLQGTSGGDGMVFIKQAAGQTSNLLMIVRSDSSYVVAVTPTFLNLQLDLRFANNSKILWFWGSTIQAVQGEDLYLADASHAVSVRNGTAPQAFRVYNTYTSASAYERLDIRWVSNVCYAKPANAGTGQARLFIPVTGATTVALLPTAATAGIGARAFVTDATATTFLSVVAGGGANKVPVVSDGTNWLIG